MCGSPLALGDLQVDTGVTIPGREIELSAIRASGPGGQHVNKTASAIHLRFDIRASSLPEAVRARLLALRDRRIARGVLVIKAQRFRSQERNVEDARERLRELVAAALHEPKARRATRPTRGSQERRLAGKQARGSVKSLRGRIKGEWD